MAKNKKSFFERLTGSVAVTEDESVQENVIVNDASGEWVAEQTEEEGGQLAVDVYQTQDDIVIKTMVAGVRPEDLDISITRDMVTIKGNREAGTEVGEENYYFKELYWGQFSRTIVLPQEIEVEEADAVEKHGLLIIKLPKVDKGRQTKLRVKTA